MRSITNRTKHELILEAYSLLCDVTPKKYDCGILCDGACCKENAAHGDEHYGMLLLPGERELIDGAMEFSFFETDEGTIVECDGHCTRELRPFACRIFPYYPHIETFGSLVSISIRKDPRSMGVCPIFHDKRRKGNIRFLRNMKRAVRILMKDEDIKKELISLSEMASDIEKMRKMFQK